MFDIKQILKFSIVFVACFTYSFVRYILFGKVELKDIPTVIVNKSVAFTIVIWLFFLLKSYLSNNQEKLKKDLKLIQSLIFIHIFLSLLLIGTHQITKFYQNNSLTFTANMSILLGLLTQATFFTLFNNFRQILLFSFLLKVHLAFIGYRNWLTPENWNGGMPPITLLCFLALFLFDVYIIRKKKSNN